jgi:hypothetical protein
MRGRGRQKLLTTIARLNWIGGRVQVLDRRRRAKLGVSRRQSARVRAYESLLFATFGSADDAGDGEYPHGGTALKHVASRESFFHAGLLI